MAMYLMGTIGPIAELCVGIQKSLATPLQVPKMFIHGVKKNWPCS